MKTLLTIPLIFASVLLASSQTVLHSTGILTGASPAERIDIDISGLDNLWLMAEGIPTRQHGHAIWGEAVLIDADGAVTRLSTLTPVSGKPTVNRNLNGESLRIGNRMLSHGLFAHADSALHYRLGKRYVRLRALVGVESLAQGNGRVRFTVATSEVRIAKAE